MQAVNYGRDEKEQMGREGLCGCPEKLNPKGKRKTYGYFREGRKR